MASTIVCGLALGAAGSALAQANCNPKDPGCDAGGELVVTGSRIPRPNLVSPTPVTVIDARRVELTGDVNTGDIIRTLPAVGLSALTPTNSNFLTTAVGITTVNLRNLGEDRTLVLQNGRR